VEAASTVGVELPLVTEIVLAPMLAWLKVAVSPGGTPLALNEIAELKVF